MNEVKTNMEQTPWCFAGLPNELDGHTIEIGWVAPKGLGFVPTPRLEAVLEALSGLEATEQELVGVYLSVDVKEPEFCGGIEIYPDMGGFPEVLSAAGQIARRLLDAGVIQTFGATNADEIATDFLKEALRTQPEPAAVSIEDQAAQFLRDQLKAGPRLAAEV